MRRWRIFKDKKKNMPISGAEVQSIVDYTEQCVKHCYDGEVMCVHAEIGSRIMHEIEEHKSGRSLAPVEKVDIGVEVKGIEALEQLFQTQATITRLSVSRISCKAEVCKLSEVTMYITKLCNKLVKHGVKIDCHLKYPSNGLLIKSKTKNIGANQYRIHFTPTLRGQYELMVSVDGKQVAGSPFPVFVFIPPARLGQLVKVWDGLTRPSGIAINTEGYIIVAEYDGDVVVLGKEGKQLRSINHSEHQFRYLQGVAVDSENNIYFTDLLTN